MVSVVLKDYIEKNNVSLSEVGKDLYTTVRSAFQKSEKVQIDMLGVAALPSSLLNTFLGDLIKDYGLSILKEIIFLNLTKVQAQRLVKYVDDIREVSGRY